jgi:hypothetical protein
MTKDQKMEHVRIIFELVPDEYGWPPAGAETLWARKVGENEYEIDNIPFYVKGVSAEDVVSVLEKDGVRFFEKVLKDSGHLTLRVIIKRDPQLGDSLRQFIRERGGAVEKMNRGHLEGFYAIDIPPSVQFDAILQYLQEGRSRGDWDYDEGKVPN